MQKVPFLLKKLEAWFELRQRSHSVLFMALKLLFNTSRKIGLEQNKYEKLSVSSKMDIQNVINFFHYLKI